MENEFDGNKQLLLAVLWEARERGIDLSVLSEDVSSGIMGNKIYTYVGGAYKTKVLNALEIAIQDLPPRSES